jgi:hypothetical protein
MNGSDTPIFDQLVAEIGHPWLMFDLVWPKWHISEGIWWIPT